MQKELISTYSLTARREIESNNKWRARAVQAREQLRVLRVNYIQILSKELLDQYNGDSKYLTRRIENVARGKAVDHSLTMILEKLVITQRQNQ